MVVILNTALFSSAKTDWETPQGIFDELDGEFHFQLDPCASDSNTKCKAYFSSDGLERGWANYGSVFVNPPYGRGLGDWVKKAQVESQSGCVVVMLLPARTDTRWFHDWVLPWAKEIRFIRGRLKFGGATNSAPFPSMIVVFGGERI